MMSQYEVLLFDIDEEKVKAVVPAMPGCEACGNTDAEALVKVQKVLSDMLRRVRWTTVEVATAVDENPLLVSNKELEEIAAAGPDHPRYWEALEAVTEQFNAELERKGYTLEKMLTDLPTARQALWEQKYALLLERAVACLPLAQAGTTAFIGKSKESAGD